MLALFYPPHNGVTADNPVRDFGAIHGASDKNGAYPDRDPTTLGDIAATMYALLGIDPGTEIHDRLDRPLPIAQGRPIHPIMT